MFLEKGPLYLVGVSRTGEPPAAVHLLLDLLHAQLLCVLTQGFHSMFARNPRYDSRRLLGMLQLCLLSQHVEASIPAGTCGS